MAGLALNAFTASNATWHIPNDAHPEFPPQVSIVRACRTGCASVPPFWMAVPTTNTMTTFGYPGGNVQEGLLTYGLWDAAESRLAATVLSHGCSQGRLMVDVGSNTGFYSAMALSAGCHVQAFDGSAVHAPYIELTAQLSGRPRSALEWTNSLVSDVSEAREFNHWSIAFSDKTGQPRSKVQSIRLDEVLTGNRVWYMKVDVEGHEPEVFRGMRRLLSRSRVQVILWEHTPHLYARKRDREKPPKAWLEEMGYWVSRLHGGGARNYVALHSSVDPVLRRAVKAMQEDNIADVLKGAGIDAHYKKGSKKLTQAPRR